jgi:hypothetical protein
MYLYVESSNPIRSDPSGIPKESSGGVLRRPFEMELYSLVVQHVDCTVLTIGIAIGIDSR